MLRRAVPLLIAILLVGAAFVARPRPATEVGVERAPVAAPSVVPEVRLAPAPPRLGTLPPLEPTAPSLSGDVVLADGSPVADASLQLFALPSTSEASATLAKPFEVSANSVGRFEYADLGPATYVLFGRHASGAIGMFPEPIVVPGQESHVVIRLLPEAAIEGRVVSEGTVPVASAHLETTPLSDALRLPRALRERLTIETTVDESGRFRIAPLLSGLHTIVARAEGFVPLTVPGVAAPAQELLLRMDRAGAIDMVVTIVGATLPAEIRVAVGLDRTVRVEITDTETPVRIDGLPAGAYEVAAEAVGFTRASEIVKLIAGGVAGPIRLVIAPAVEVTGRVLRNEDGTPVPGARITLAYEETTAGAVVPRVEPPLTTDAQGVWHARLRAGTWVLRVGKAGFVQGETPRALAPAAGVPDEATVLLGARFVVAQEPIALETYLLPAPAIVGTVLDERGQPVAKAHIVVSGAGASPDAPSGSVVLLSADMQAETSPDGTFRIEVISTSAKYDLRAEAEPGEGTASVTFAAGERLAHAELRLAKRASVGARLRGRVVDAGGHPIPGATVLVVRLSPRPKNYAPMSIARLTTAADGRFTVRNLIAGVYRGELTAATFPFTYSPPITIAENEDVAAQDWVMPATGLSVKGRVTDVAGHPISNMLVLADFKFRVDALPRMCGGHTDAEGRYEILGPAGPACDVSVFARGGGFLYVDGLGSADPAAVVDLTMSRPGVVSGSIAFRGPTPVSVLVTYPREIQVSRTRRFTAWWDLPVKWDARGRTYEVGKVSPGRQRLRFLAPGYAPSAIQEVEVGDAGAATLAAFEMTPGGTLKGRLLAAQGSPLSGAQVQISDDEDDGRRLYTERGTDGDGRFRLEHIPPGTWTFQINRHDVVQESRPTFKATIEEGKATEVQWVLPP